jgi:hypothetical protein
LPVGYVLPGHYRLEPLDSRDLRRVDLVEESVGVRTPQYLPVKKTVKPKSSRKADPPVTTSTPSLRGIALPLYR